MTAYVGLDIGGTGAKAGVFDENGTLLGLANKTFTGESCGTEVPIEAIYASARAAVSEAVSSAGVETAAMAVSSQGQTFVSLDREGRPLHDAIIWYDSRAGSEAETMRNKTVEALGGRRAPHIEAICTAAKVMWLRAHQPEAMETAAWFLLLPDYISYRLTGQPVTDPSTAMSTGLYVEDEADYCDEALAAAGIDKVQIARIARPGEKIGKIKPDLADEWGLSPGTLLVTGTNDQYAGALGAGNCRPGIVSETTGTCLALVTLAGKLPDPIPEGLICGRFPIPQYSYVLAYSKTAGIVLDWFRNQFAQGLSHNELNQMAAEVPIGSGGVIVLPHFDGKVSPKPDPKARGFICNLTLDATPATIYRAIMESIAFSLRENIEHVQASGFPVDVIRSIGGGAKSDLWLQMKADVMGLNVERPSVTESATLGAAMLAAVGTGQFASAEEASASWYRVGRVFKANAWSYEAYEKPYFNYRELCKCCRLEESRFATLW